MEVIPVSLADSSILLLLEDGAYHVHMTIPFSLMGHFNPSIIQCRPRNPWVARLFGQGHHPSCKVFVLHIRHLREISLQLSSLLFGREERVGYNKGSCDADNWEQLGGSNFHLSFFVGAKDSGNIRLLVFETHEKLVQGSIHFSGKELGEKEKAAWTEGWMNLVQPCQELEEVFSTPLDCEIMNKNYVRLLHQKYRAKVPGILEEKESPESADRKCQPPVRSFRFKQLFGAISLRSCMSCA